MDAGYANLNEDILKIITYEKGVRPSDFGEKLSKNLII